MWLQIACTKMALIFLWLFFKSTTNLIKECKKFNFERFGKRYLNSEFKNFRQKKAGKYPDLKEEDVTLIKKK